MSVSFRQSVKGRVPRNAGGEEDRRCVLWLFEC